MRRSLATLSLALCAGTVACGGSGVQGEYIGTKGESFFDSLTFRSDGKVEVVLIGVRHEGSYEVDGDQVTITAPNGDRNPLQLESNGCLTHPIAGTYCKSGVAPTTAARSESSASQGEVYEARAREGLIRLEFGAARKARITMVPTGIADAPDQMSFDVSYAVSGDQITVNLPGNEPLMLTRAGGDLEGTMNGETVRFVKR
jgi:hypothetical protein